MNRRDVVMTGLATLVASATLTGADDAELTQLLVDIDAILLAALGWDVPKALKKEIELVRGRIAQRLAQ